MRIINNDIRKDVLKLQSEATKRERTLKSTELKTEQVSNKLRGTKSASSKLKRQLKENDKNVKKPRYFLVDTFSHGKNRTNHRTVMLMANMRYLQQHACLLSSQKTPIALHLMFSILFNCSPPTNVAVSPSTMADWNILLGEADKLILRIGNTISMYGVMTPTKVVKSGTS